MLNIAYYEKRADKYHKEWRAAINKVTALENEITQYKQVLKDNKIYVVYLKGIDYENNRNIRKV